MMKLLENPTEIDREFQRLLKAGYRIHAAVAWASLGFPSADLLLRRASQIERLVVGLHFYQTDPNFIERCLTLDNVRFKKATSGVFHPKVYLFTKGKLWECIIGSANLTGGGFGGNEELAVLIDSEDPGATAVRKRLLRLLSTYWDGASPMTAADLAGYRRCYALRKPIVDKLRGEFGKSSKRRPHDRGRQVFETPILVMDWPEFVRKVRCDPRLELRRTVLRLARECFQTSKTFAEMTAADRRRIAGFATDSNPDWRIFGSMVGAGTFKKAVNENVHELSEALDSIPLSGPINEAQYTKYTESFKRAFPTKRGTGNSAIATATRLLAMKRPDYFVCIDSRNRQLLCGAFKIPQSIGVAEYWSSVCKRVHQSTWWNEPAPEDPADLELWVGRAALLDALYYAPAS